MLVGHGGRIGRGCRLRSSIDVGEVGCGKLRQTVSVLALRAQAAGGHCIIARRVALSCRMDCREAVCFAACASMVLLSTMHSPWSGNFVHAG